MIRLHVPPQKLAILQRFASEMPLILRGYMEYCDSTLESLAISLEKEGTLCRHNYNHIRKPHN
jgi:hypothetical protein